MRLVAEDGELPEADLVQDLAGLLVLEVVDLLALQRRQRVQCAARELRADEERLVGGDQRVAPEDRHEPGQPGGRKRELVPLDRRVQAQRREVDDGLLVDELEQIPVGLDLRRALAPLLHVVRLAPGPQDAARLARLEDQRLEGAPLAEGDLDPGLPDDLRLRLVAALAARAPRLPRLPTAGHLRGLDEAGRRAQRLLAALPRLRARHQRVPVAEEQLPASDSGGPQRCSGRRPGRTRPRRRCMPQRDIAAPSLSFERSSHRRFRSALRFPPAVLSPRPLRAHGDQAHAPLLPSG